MNRITFTFLLVMGFLAGYTQMYNSGGTITVETGATLVIEGDYTSTSSGTIEIDGTVELKGDFINNSGSIATESNGGITFKGTTAQEITGAQSTTFYCAVTIDNAAGVALTNTSTGASQVFDSVLTFTNGDLTLNDFNLTLNEGFTGADANKHIVTNGAGAVKAYVGNTNVTFPVGDGTVYNPLVLNEAGTADTFAVQYANTHPGGWTGGLSHTVLGHWTVSEVTSGGSNLAVTPQWVGTQEQSSFDRTDCAVGVSTDNGATVAWKETSAAAGTNPYTQTGSGFTTLGKFMVADYWFGGIDVDLDLFLAGPYSGGTMTTNLKTKGLIPLTDPYGLGVTVSSIPANTVDWIKVELRDKTNSANILYTKAFFLDNTGNVMSPDGSGTAKFASVPKDQYYIAVKHRNHLGAMTSATVDLTGASPSFNFKSGAGVFQTQTYTPMFSLGSGNYGLYKGNVNGDAAVRKAGTPAINDYTTLLTYLGANLFITNVYAGGDINLDGDVRKAGTPAINDYSHLLTSLGSNLFILEQVP